jgi:hypothetical protein
MARDADALAHAAGKFLRETAGYFRFRVGRRRLLFGRLPV